MENKTQKISISSFLYGYSPKLFIFAVVVGAAAGALYSLIIPFVLHSLQQRNGSAATELSLESQHSGVGGFFLICASILIAKAFSVILINNIAKSAVADLRIGLAKKINKMMIANVESIGFPRLFNIITDDVNNLAAAAVAIPMLSVSIVTIIGMLGYLAALNLYVFLVVLASIFLGIFLFKTPVAMASGVYERARVLRDEIQESLRGLVMGSYELKLSKSKSDTYIDDELVGPQKESARLEKVGDAILHIAGTSSDLLSFFIIGLIVFVVPIYVNFPASESYGVVMALLYIAGPVAGVLSMIQHLKVGDIALQRINQLNHYDEDSYPHALSSSLKPWENFNVREVIYSYPKQSDSNEQTFSLDSINFTFCAGQINFIVGGNGSGKSTLGKLLSLHYVPTSGGIYFDDMLIDSENIVHARSRISVVFSNYYLFSKLYQIVDSDKEEKIKNYLKSLGLEGKTEFVDGRFTTTKLSDGQRRRLALLVALLDDKDIYIFDEWAADQDPEFKKIFYEDILQEMKYNNKLVIVITHDDRYFDCADRIIFMDGGRVVNEKNRHSDDAVSNANVVTDDSLILI